MVHCLFNGLRIKKILRHTVQVQVLNLILILGYLIYVLPAEKKKIFTVLTIGYLHNLEGKCKNCKTVLLVLVTSYIH